MADWTPEDLSREIDRLWARVGALPAEPSSAASVPATPAAAGLAGAEAAWETVGLLKRQQRQRESSWQAAMEARDEALRALRARLETAETEAERLRGRVESEDERALVETLGAQEKVEAARAALAFAQKRHDEERRALEETLQAMRERLAAEAARARAAEQRAQSREQAGLIELKELQSLVARRDKDAKSAAETVRGLQASLAEAKGALEKTLAELLLERRERERAHGEREAALKKVEELRAHVDELSRIWDEERGQWRELWDRERSTWEAQRTELAHWEENLRREREAWHAELETKEKAHLALTEDLAGKVRETSRTAEKMSELLTGFEAKSAEDAARSTLSAEGALRAAAAAARTRARRRRWAAGAAAAVLLAAAARPAWRAATAWRYAVEATSPAPTAEPAGLAFDGSLLWVADWGGTLVAADPADPRAAARRAAPAPGKPYRPTAIAVGGGALWTLDAAQARLIRHSAAAPEKILAARPSPGPAPTALAFDGETVWSYDAVARALTRHGGDDAPVQSYSLPDDAVPNAMAWVGSRLWVHDAKAGRILVYALEGGRLSRLSAQPDPEPGVIGLAVAGEGAARRLYVLLGPSGSRARAAIARYRVRRLLPFPDF